MQRIVFLGALLASVILALVNNLVNPNSIPWIGSPDILEKPSGWPSLSLGQGVVAGVMVAWKDAVKHAPYLLGLLVVIVGVAWFQKARRGISPSPWLFTVLRLFLSFMFLSAAWPKFTDPQGFSSLVAQYQFMPAFSVDLFSLWLPAFEIVVALGLIFTPWEKEFGTLVMVLLGMFLVALGQALVRDLGIACGCFDIEGAADAGETWFSFLRDVVLVIPVGALMVWGKRRWFWQLR